MRVISASLIGLLCLTQAVSLLAQDAPSKPETTVIIYRVGDLVAQQTVRKSLREDSVTREEFSGEHVESIASLQKLAELVEMIVPTESGAVAAHEDTLSLVVRHSTTGHQQIEALLQQLREQERPIVELTLIPMTGGEVEELIEKFKFQTSYDPETTGEILNFLKSREELRQQREDQALFKPLKVLLTNGRKTSCGHLMFHLYVTALATAESDEIRLRIDSNTNFEGTKQEMLQIRTQSFAILPGHSSLLFPGCDLNDDGHDDMLLAVPKRIELEQNVATDSRYVFE